jgi:RimK-like ATP-grasp domain
MTFYAIHEGFYEGVEIRLDSLKTACIAKAVAFVQIDSLTTDYTSLPRLGKQDLLYNTVRGSQTLESLLLNADVTTFYQQNPTTNFLRSSTEWSLIHDKLGLPAPRTVYHLTTDRILLQRYVAYLGGFPIVLKVTGGTRGIGTIKAESWHSLYSLVDYLATTGDDFVVRQFIEADYGVRAMVLGERVIAAAKFFMQENDFRNAPLLANTHYERTTLTPEHEALCVRAVRSVNLEMAGVDLLFDKAGNAYLLEINFPTGFQALIDVCGVDIPSLTVEFLIQKSLNAQSL